MSRLRLPTNACDCRREGGGRKSKAGIYRSVLVADNQDWGLLED